MVNGGSDRCGNASKPDFTNPARTQWVDLLVGKVQKVHFNDRRISIYWDHIVGQVAVERRAGCGIVVSVLEEGHSNTHHHCSLDLVATRERIEDTTGVNHGNYPADSQSSNLWLPSDFNEVTAE